MKKILSTAFVIVFCMVIYQPAAYSGNPFKGIKDSMIKKYAGCYKKSEVERSQCESIQTADIKGIDKEIKKTIKNSKKKGQTERAYWYYGEEITKLTNEKQRLIDSYDVCKDKATKYLLDCRLDKKKFKKGCDEKEMEADLKKLDDKANAVRENYEKCVPACRATLEKAYKKAGNKLEIGFNDSVPLIDDYFKCAKGCDSKFNNSKYENEKSMQNKRYAILEKCIDLGK